MGMGRRRRGKKRSGRAFNGGLVEQCPKLGWLHFSGDSFFEHMKCEKNGLENRHFGGKKRSLFRRLLWAKRTCARLLLFFSLSLAHAQSSILARLYRKVPIEYNISVIFAFFPFCFIQISMDCMRIFFCPVPIALTQVNSFVISFCLWTMLKSINDYVVIFFIFIFISLSFCHLTFYYLILSVTFAHSLSLSPSLVKSKRIVLWTSKTNERRRRRRRRKKRQNKSRFLHQIDIEQHDCLFESIVVSIRINAFQRCVIWFIRTVDFMFLYDMRAPKQV